jgi:hypothetical protein
VVLQRPYSNGYESEYPGWVLQRDEFLDAAAATNCTLVREFLIGETIRLDEIPEPCHYAGYLFAA